MISYASEAEFYEGRDDRQRSGEVDFGVWWTADYHHWPRLRLSWVEATGELILVAPKGRLEVLGVIFKRSDVDAALDGWTEQIHKPNSVAWIVHRLSEWAVTA